MENKKRIPYTYKEDDQVLVKNERSTKYGQNAYNGPWTILEVCPNGTVLVQNGTVTDVYNLHNITPYKSS